MTNTAERDREADEIWPRQGQVVVGCRLCPRIRRSLPRPTTRRGGSDAKRND